MVDDPVKSELTTDDTSAETASGDKAVGAEVIDSNAESVQDEAANSDAVGESTEPVAGEMVETSDTVDELDDDFDDDGDVADDVDDNMDAQPLEFIEESDEEDLDRNWYILKVQVNRENSICEALQRRVKVEGLERFFGDILVPTEDVREFTKTGKQRVVKRKLYPGYIVVNMSINDDTWFLVRETPGIGDFTGSIGKPTPMLQHEIDRILKVSRPEDPEDGEAVKTNIRFKQGDRVRVKEGHFQNFEGEIDGVDETHGRVTVMINIFGRPTPVELEHWQVEDV